MVSACLVIPAYNEADNLEPLVRAVEPRLAAAADGHRVLLVVDRSPDGTDAVADRLASEIDAVDVLHRPFKGGLGPAYVAGLTRALAERWDLVVQMDADLSHDPADVPRLIEAAARADLVIGSRYVAGGGVAHWGPARRLVSRVGSLYAQQVLGVPVRDLTGGFKCIRRAVLERIDLTSLHASGYVFQVEVTYRAIEAGFRVEEVPIVFRARRAGASKMTAPIALEAAWRVPTLRAGRR